MRRRDFIKIIPGLAAACPLLARAQQFKRRIGVVIARLENDPVGQAEIAALFDNLRQLGWTVGAGGNSQVDYRWPGSDIERIRADVAEIVGLHPDVIIAHSTPVNLALQRATRTIPIVFVNVTDPIGSGLVESLAHPGGNITGFSNYESGLAIVGKWIETLKEIDRRIERFRSTCSPVAVSSAPRQGCGGPPAPGKDLKRVEIFSSQGTLETDKANYRPPALASRAGGPPGPMRAIDVFDQLVENPCLRQGDALDRHRRRLPMDLGWTAARPGRPAHRM